MKEKDKALQGADAIRILFVCHGNICRSPMAEFVFKAMVGLAGRQDDFHIESAATSDDETGNPVYPPVRRLLEKHGLDCTKKRARRLVRQDYDRFDFIIGMDSENMAEMLRLFGGDPKGKVSRLMEFDGQIRDIADPWYTRDFDTTWEDVNRGCAGLLSGF
ncbi:MAG: low molecular weight protein-tyrosine-phosphatase [Clostridia bacterium]|nr:low molecular weight protein-tyrosine-phosphatase [Clostridia bacterium]